MGLHCLSIITTLSLRPVVCLYSPTHTAGWKETEGMKLKGITVTSPLTDNLQGELQRSDDPMLDILLKSWQKIVKVCRIENASKLLRCLVIHILHQIKITADLRNRPQRSHYLFLHKGAFQSFAALQNEYRLGKDDFYRYLQVGHYFNMCSKAEIYRIFEVTLRVQRDPFLLPIDSNTIISQNITLVCGNSCPCLVNFVISGTVMLQKIHLQIQ